MEEIEMTPVEADGAEEQEQELVEEGEQDIDEDEEGEGQEQVVHAVYAHAPIQTCRQTFAPGEPTLVNESPSNHNEQLSSTPSPAPKPRGGDEEDEVEKSFATPPSDPPSSNSSHESPLLNHQRRFLQLQAFLKLCDEADQKDLLQALRSLSAAARSGHAFNLEYRALLLSMEEGREMLRLKMLNVMGGRSKEDQTSTPGSTPEGSRLPAPGAIDLGD